MKTVFSQIMEKFQNKYLFIFLDMINVPRQIAHVQIKLLTQVEANFDATILRMSRALSRIVSKVKIVEFFKADVSGHNFCSVGNFNTLSRAKL